MAISVKEKGKLVDPIGYMSVALLEAKKAQVVEAKKNGEKIKLASMTGGVGIMGAKDVDGGILPIIGVNNIESGMEEVIEKVDLSPKERERINFLVGELKISPWVACLESLGVDIPNEDKWKNEMLGFYGVPESNIIPAIVSVTGMPEQYKTFWLTYMASRGQVVVGLDPHSADSWQNYAQQADINPDMTIEELVGGVNFEKNPRTQLANEYWKVNNQGKTQLIKKQGYLHPGMSSVPEGLVQAVVGDGVVSLDVGVDIDRERKMDNSKALKATALAEFRRVMGGGKRPEVIWADMTGYWVRKGNIYDMVALESMTCMVPQRVESNFHNEWAVRDDAMNVKVLYDYYNFWLANGNRIISADTARTNLVMASINNDNDVATEARKQMVAFTEKVIKPKPPVTQDKFIRPFKEVLRAFAYNEATEHQEGLFEEKNQAEYNNNQKLMADILAEAEVGEALGVAGKNDSLGHELLKMLDDGCVVIPIATKDGYVCVDKDGVFLLQTEDHQQIENLLNAVGSQTTKFVLEYTNRDTNFSWRHAEHWVGKNVAVVPVEGDKAQELVKNSQELVRQRPFYSSTDYSIWESRGQEGTVRIFSNFLSNTQSQR